MGSEYGGASAIADRIVLLDAASHPAAHKKHGQACPTPSPKTQVHKALREPYGAPYKEGDVVGMLLHLPPGGKTLEASDQDVVRYKGGLYVVQEDLADPAVSVLSGARAGRGQCEARTALALLHEA